MPLHEYECETCGHRFEVIQKFSDSPIEVCPKCGNHVRKLISSPAIQFKGSGWYITDYAKKDSTPAGKTAESGSGGSAAKESGGSTEKAASGDKSAPASDSSSSPSPAPKPAAKE